MHGFLKLFCATALSHGVHGISSSDNGGWFDGMLGLLREGVSADEKTAGEPSSCHADRPKGLKAEDADGCRDGRVRGEKGAPFALLTSTTQADGVWGENVTAPEDMRIAFTERATDAKQAVVSLATVAHSSASSSNRESLMQSDFVDFLTKKKMGAEFPARKKPTKGRKGTGEAVPGSLTFASFMAEWAGILDRGVVENALDDWFKRVVADPYQFYQTVLKKSIMSQDVVRKMVEQAISKPSAKKNAHNVVNKGTNGVEIRTQTDLARHKHSDAAKKRAVKNEIERYFAGLSMNSAKLASKTVVETLSDDAFLAKCFDETEANVAMGEGSADINNAVTYVRLVRTDIKKHVAQTLNHNAMRFVIDSVIGKLTSAINGKGSEFEAIKKQPKGPVTFRELFFAWLKAAVGSTDLGKDELNFGHILLGIFAVAPRERRLPGGAEVYAAAQRAELAVHGQDLSQDEWVMLYSSLQMMWALLESVWGGPDDSFVPQPRDVVKILKARLHALFPKAEQATLKFINGQQALDDWSTSMYTAAARGNGGMAEIWNEATFKSTQFKRARAAYDKILKEAEQERERAGKAKIEELNELQRMFAKSAQAP